MSRPALRNAILKINFLLLRDIIIGVLVRCRNQFHRRPFSFHP